MPSAIECVDTKGVAGRLRGVLVIKFPC